MTSFNPAEPTPCWLPFSTEAGGLHYIWRGCSPGRRSTTIGVFNSHTEQWSLKPTTGYTPPGLQSGSCVCVGDYLYTFGGSDGSLFFHDVHKLDINTLEWSKIKPSGSQPMMKFGGGLVHVDYNTLCCFGGYGIGPTQQPGATFTRKKKFSDGTGWTNELHIFNIQNGVWSSPEIRGERPPPCSNFTFTKMDQHRAVLFGGRQPGSNTKGNDVYLLNFRNMEFTKLEPLPGESWPVGRSGHAACCLNYGEDHPQLLVSGGLDKDTKTLEDIWILDVDTGNWTEVIPPKSYKSRFFHSTTATSLGPGLAEVLVFGGCVEWPKSTKTSDDLVSVAETTLLRFESSQTIAGSPTGKWALVDVARNITRSSCQRVEEKMAKIRQSDRFLSPIESSSFLDQMRDVEQQLRATQDLLQQKEQELTEANCHCKAAEQRAQLAEQREQAIRDRGRDLEQQLQAAEQREDIIHNLLQQKEQELTEANRHRETAEQRERAAQHHYEEQLQEKDRELAAVKQRARLIEQREQALRSELEGKSRELAAHNSELWRIPSTRVNTVRTIGTGGWGEVLEGTVRVAMKRLHSTIVNQRNLERLQREMRLLAEVRHPNLVQFIGAVFDQSPPLIITELLDMNLRQAYEQNQLRAGDRHSIFIDTARALDYLHQRYKPIIHRDVSAPNVLLQKMSDNHWKGKISDLGSANFLQQAQTMGEGAIVYSPPEVIPRPFVRPQPQTGKIDVYSFGVLMAEVTTSQFPSQENFMAMFEFVQREYPQILYDLIVHCTKRDPSDRPTMAEVLVELGRLNSF